METRKDVLTLEEISKAQTYCWDTKVNPNCMKCPLHKRCIETSTRVDIRIVTAKDFLRQHIRYRLNRRLDRI